MQLFYLKEKTGEWICQDWSQRVKKEIKNEIVVSKKAIN